MPLKSFPKKEVINRLFENNQHLLLIYLIILIEIRIFNKFLHLNSSNNPTFAQVLQSISKEVIDLKIFKPTILIDIIFAKYLIHCLPEPILSNF